MDDITIHIILQHVQSSNNYPDSYDEIKGHLNYINSEVIMAK